MNYKTGYPKTLKTLNKFIQHEIRSTIFVVKGEGYFYITSDDKDTALEISRLPQTGIYVYKVSMLSFESWYQTIYSLLNNKQNILSQ